MLGPARVHSVSDGRAATDWSLLVLRAIVGFGFMAHGFAKLSKGADAFAEILRALGVPTPQMTAWATILVELVGGFAVLVGAFTWLVSIPMIVVMLVAIVTVHLPNGFSSIKLVAVANGRAQFGSPGYETALLYVACLVALVLGGPGSLSVDHLVARRRGRIKRFWLNVFPLIVIAGVMIVSTPNPSRGEQVQAAAPTQFKAVAFDYFVLFNPDSIVEAADAMYPGRGRELTTVWRNRQFEYSWLRSAMGRYEDFSAVTGDALVYAAEALKLPMTAEQKRLLVDAYLHLTLWPDTAASLRRLRESGIRVISLANFSPMMLRANAEHAGIADLFEALISTDANHTFKPDPRAYKLGTDFLRVPRRDVVFAAFGGWDAAGAKSFGYPTVWVNRFNQPREELGSVPDITVPDMDGLLAFILNGTPGHAASPDNRTPRGLP